MARHVTPGPDSGAGYVFRFGPGTWQGPPRFHATPCDSKLGCSASTCVHPYPLVSMDTLSNFVQVSSSLKELAMPVDSRTQVRGISAQVWVVSGPMACIKDINQHCANLSLQKSLRS